MIIVGLGNPGSSYAATRHNIGFMIVDQLVAKLAGSPWTTDRQVSWSKIGPHLLIKPQAMMNLSGPALHDFFSYKQLPLDPTELSEQLLVIHDELDFPVGQLKIQTARSSAGHNGVQSIIDAWGGWQGFSRLRVGIGDNRAASLPAEDYVLQPFTAAEQPLIDQQIMAAVELLRPKLI